MAERKIKATDARAGVVNAAMRAEVDIERAALVRDIGRRRPIRFGEPAWGLIDPRGGGLLDPPGRWWEPITSAAITDAIRVARKYGATEIGIEREGCWWNTYAEMFAGEDDVIDDRRYAGVTITLEEAGE